MADKIKQPKNAEIKAENARLQLVWKNTFGRDNTSRFDNVQKFVDSECIRLMVQYTPMKNGLLYKSAVAGTKIGKGHIHYASPYARYQYYGKVMVSSVTGSAFARQGESKVLTNRELKYSTARHPQAQKLWFETMKTNHKEQILRGAAAISKKG